MRLRVLVVDDEPQSLKYVRVNLAARGYDVVTAADGESAIRVLGTEEFDLVILDIGLPRLDGFAVLEQLRGWSEVPVIILTARDADGDKIRALDLGGDDYLTKPFSIGELLARIRAVLRRVRSKDGGGSRDAVAVGDVQIDFQRRKVARRGSEIRLTPTEYNLIEQLATYPGRVLTHRLLLEKVWGSEYRDQVHYLYAYMGRLRQKVEDDPAHPRYILTEPGVGYRFADA